MLNAEKKSFRLRSFVCRNGRRTAGQDQAYQALWPRIGLSLEQGMLSLPAVFQREAPTVLEIGFGMGVSLLALAKNRPELNIIGVETHLPGNGAVCLGIQENQLANIRLFNRDVIDVLEQCIPDESLDAISIFFPDPWQKRKHHPRRLIQPAFLKLILPKLKQNGECHLATDWDDYAVHMMRTVSAEPGFENLAGIGQYAERSPYRPVITKFENRALRENRKIYDIRLQKR